MRKAETKYLLGKVKVAYDFEKLDILKIELFEIVNKLHRYKRITKKWHLKPLYYVVCFLSSLIAECEAIKNRI